MSGSNKFLREKELAVRLSAESNMINWYSNFQGEEKKDEDGFILSNSYK